MSRVSPSDRDAYDQLLEQLDLRRPAWGWTNERDLPRLKAKDLATCLRARPNLFDDFLADKDSAFWAAELSDCIEQDSVGEYLAAAFFAHLNRECRRELTTALIERQEDGEGHDLEAQEADSLNDAERAGA